jgi:uncharacterized protein YbbC (DUF1343 family)/CubicO group peptidase (beta-lactamase class C family)
MRNSCCLALAVCLLLPAAGRPEDRLASIRPTVEAAIAHGDLPGAVVAVWHDGKVVYREAFGRRAVKPKPEPMTVDTIFDMASLTKPLATATSAMLLVEQGKLKLDEKVATYWPAFAAHGKDAITIENLLLHTSGLIADNPVTDYADGTGKALDRICQLRPQSAPGAKFTYSDVNFIVLGEIVGRISGMPLHDFARQFVFEPIGMGHTGFKPVAANECAPTESRDGHWMRGEVHDPRAYALGGVAGHAGLFSTADDVLLYARMILDGGKAANGNQVLKPETVKLMTTPRPVPGGQRALGWDVDTSYSRNRGSLFPRGKSFGHTGFTGTSIWIDPGSKTAVVFLSNRVHPDGKGNVTRLRGQVATIVAQAMGYGNASLTPQPPLPQGERGSKISSPPSPPVGEGGRGGEGMHVLTGIDVLEKENFARLKGKRIGLVTNHTGRDRSGRATIDLLHHADGAMLVALFSPEHGIRGAVDENVSDTKDEKSGLPVYSLYGPRHKPTAELLKGIDTLVYDIQDVGCRYYTYISTLGMTLEAGADNKIKVIVLDRPNPMGGVAVAGPVRDETMDSTFVAWHPLPLRHGLTVGELARLFKDERHIDVDLDVVRCEGWHRADFYDKTLLPWVDPSPNMRSLTQALLYPGTGLLETTNVSVGRGTDQPFEWFGAPWIDGPRLAAALADRRLAGVRFVPVSRTPVSSTHAKKDCGGVQVIVDDWDTFEPVRTGITIAVELHRLYPNEWMIDRYNRLLGHAATFEGIKAGKSADELEHGWQADLDAFKARRRKYLLYE